MLWLLFLFFVSTQAEWNLEDWLGQKVNDPLSSSDIRTLDPSKELEYRKEETDMEIKREEPTALDPHFGSLDSTQHYISFEYPTQQTFDVAKDISETCRDHKLGFPIRHKEDTKIYFKGATIHDNHKVYMKRVKENELWCSIPITGKKYKVDCEDWTCTKINGGSFDDPFEIAETTENAFDFFGRTIQRLEVSLGDVLNITERVMGTATTESMIFGTTEKKETMAITQVVERGDKDSLCTMWNAVGNGGVLYGAFGGTHGENELDSCAEIGWEEPSDVECADATNYNGLLDVPQIPHYNPPTGNLIKWWHYHETQPSKYNCGDLNNDIEAKFVGLNVGLNTDINQFNPYTYYTDRYDRYTHRDKYARLCKLDVRDKADRLSLLEKRKHLFYLDELFQAHNAFNYWADKMCNAPMCMMGTHDITKIDKGMVIPLILIPIDVGYSYYDMTKSGFTFTYSKDTKKSYCYYIPYEEATMGGAKVTVAPFALKYPKANIGRMQTGVWKRMRDSKLGRYAGKGFKGFASSLRKGFSKLGTKAAGFAKYTRETMRHVHHAARAHARARMHGFRRLRQLRRNARAVQAKIKSKLTRQTEFERLESQKRKIQAKQDEMTELYEEERKMNKNLALKRKNCLEGGGGDSGCRIFVLPEMVELAKVKEQILKVSKKKNKLEQSAQTTAKTINRNAKKAKRKILAKARQAKARVKLDNQIADARRFKRHGARGVGHPVKRHKDVTLFGRISEMIFHSGMRAKIKMNIQKLMRMRRQIAKHNKKVMKKAKGKAKKQTEKEADFPPPMEISYWHETGTCSDPPCSLFRRFTGNRFDSLTTHNSFGSPGTYEWGVVSMEVSLFSSSAKVSAFSATNLQWDRIILNAHAELAMPNAVEAGFALIGGFMGVMGEFLVTFEAAVGVGRMHQVPLTPYNQKLDNNMALNPALTRSDCIETDCSTPTFVSDQIKLLSSAEPFMNIPLTHYRDETNIIKYTGHIPSALPGELYLLGFAQDETSGSRNENITMNCTSGEKCTIMDETVPFDKYSALQPDKKHFELDVTSLNALGTQYIYSLEARGIEDDLIDHPYYYDSMIAIVSDETCETFGLTPILDIDNNNAVKAEVQKLFDQNDVPDPEVIYEKTSDFRDKIYYSDNNRKQIWADTSIVDTFVRYDAIYDTDDLVEPVEPVHHTITASEYHYIPPGLTVVTKDPYVTDRNLYIVKKELNPLGFRSEDTYGNPPSHTPNCTNQFKCICFKGNEYKYVRKADVSAEKSGDYDYMEQPVYSLHECNIASKSTGWKTKVGHNLITPDSVKINHAGAFGCSDQGGYWFNDIPYTTEKIEDEGFFYDFFYEGKTQTPASDANSIIKLIRRKKTSKGISNMKVLTRAEGAREADGTEHKSHIKQGEYSYFPIDHGYVRIKYLDTDMTYLYDDTTPYRLIQESEDYVYNNNGIIEIYTHEGERQEGEYGEKPDISLTMLSVQTLTDSAPQIISELTVPQIFADTADHVYNTDWSGINVTVDIFKDSILVKRAKTNLKHIACRPIVYLDGAQSYYRTADGEMKTLGTYGDLDNNTDARLCGHLPEPNVPNSISCELSHSFPNQCPEGYGMGVSKWNGTYDHTTDTGDVPFVNGDYRQCSKCPEGTTSPDGHTRCLGHEHKLGDSTLFDDPYSAYVHATHLQKYHFEEGNDYHPFYHTVGDIDYIDNEVYSDTRYLICDEGFVPKRMQMPSGVTKEDAVKEYKNTCSGYTCELCPQQFIELQQMCVPCPPGSVAGWALNSTTNPNVCVGVNVPVGHFYDSQNPDGSTVGGTNYPYATHCDHWLYHPEGGKGAYQDQENQIECKIAGSGSMAGVNGRVIERPSVPGQKVNNDRTGVINCENHQVCDGEQIIGCAPGYIWYRQTNDREDEECALCNQVHIDHDEKDDYEYCDGTHRFQCADASYTEGTLQDEVYVGVNDTWDGSNLVSYESQDETSPEGGSRMKQYTYNTTWDISQARVQKNLKWDGSDAVCKAVPDGFFALDGEWKLHDCGYATDKCIHRTFHRIYPFRHPTNLAAKYMFTEAVRETSYDEIFRMSSRQCDDGFLKDGCLKEYCSREGQTNCWCGEEEDFCKFACVDGMCLPSCGDQVCNPNYEICYGIGVDAECTRKCNGPMDNYCVADHNGYARLCRHYNEDWNTTKFEYLEPESACFEEMPNIPETQCKSTTDRNCFCGREYHDDKHKACKDREIVSSCSVIQDDGTCTYMTDSICLCGNDMINVISETCYQMNGQCGPYGNYIPDCDFHLEKITNTLTQNTTECRPTGKEALINPAQCRKGAITKKYTGTIDNIEEKFECVGDESDEPGCMDRHAKNYNQYAVIPKKCEY